MESCLLGLLTAVSFLVGSALGDAITHETNLVWAQTPFSRAHSNARLMAIAGDPNTWVTTEKFKVKNIAAPHFTWEFRALGFHWEDQLLFWSEGTNKKIQSVILNGSLDTTTLFTGSSSEVYGLTVDWLSRNLYFTDALYNWVMMTSILASKPGYRIVVQDGLDSPHGVAVHPYRRQLFWSDWGARPKIERSGLLGEDRRILLDRGLVKPQGLAIDFDNDRLYWVDSFKCTLESADLNGMGKKVLHVEEGTNFYGVALYGNYIFVTEKSKDRLEVFTSQTKVKSFRLGAVPWAVIMYGQSSQPGNSSECVDLDCEQLCVYDLQKGARCLCGEGYVPGDDGAKTCKPSEQFVHPSHFYAIGDSICHYPANMADMPLDNLTLSTQCFLGDKQHSPGYMTLTFDAAENMLYLFSNFTKTILRLPLKLGAKATAIEGGTGEVKGMSLDWVSGNLYWTDATKRAIMVAKKNGQFQKVVLDRLSTPVGIAVHPGRGKIYWTDHGHLPMIGASVEKANLDGSGRETIMAGVVWQPNHLFLDFTNESLYWADSMQHHVRKLDLVSGRITVVYEQTLVQFYGISVFNDFLIWTDTDNLNGVHMARMDTKEKVRGIIHPNVGVARDLITFDPRNQPAISNPCAHNVTKCSQLCLLAADNTPRCYCSLGYTLSDDGFTCYTSPVQENFLLVSDAFQKKIFQMDISSATVQAVDLDTTNMAIAIDYDPINSKLFWSNNIAKEIKEATIEGRYQRTVMYLNSSSACDGLAADYINRLLFFTDTGNDLIGVVSMDRSDLYTYIIKDKLEQPRDIVASPDQGAIYWSDWGEESPGIERASMDGSNRTVIFRPEAKRAWINGLALDWKGNILYWVDASADVISSIDLVTMEVSVLWSQPNSHFFSIDVVGEHIYVSDWIKNYIHRMPKSGDGKLVPFGPRKFSKLHGIRGYNKSEVFTGISVCTYSACDHLCLPKSQGGYSCRCSEGYQAINEAMTCKEILTTTARSTSTSRATTKNIPTTPSQRIDTNKTSRPSSSPPSLPPLKSPSPTPASSSSTLPSSPSSLSSISSQSTTPPVITNVPVTMATAKTRSSSNTTPSPGGGIDVVITIGPGTAPDTTTHRNTTVARSTSAEKGSGLSTLSVAIITCSIVLIIIAIIIAVAYNKKHIYKIAHGKLVEDKNPANYYQIAFNGQGDHVTFDSAGGIENPTYDYMNEPKDGDDS